MGHHGEYLVPRRQGVAENTSTSRSKHKILDKNIVLRHDACKRPGIDRHKNAVGNPIKRQK
jgi:hypothetical protein